MVKLKEKKERKQEEGQTIQDVLVNLKNRSSTVQSRELFKCRIAVHFWTAKHSNLKSFAGTK